MCAHDHGAAQEARYVLAIHRQCGNVFRDVQWRTVQHGWGPTTHSVSPPAPRASFAGAPSVVDEVAFVRRHQRLRQLRTGERAAQRAASLRGPRCARTLAGSGTPSLRLRSRCMATQNSPASSCAMDVHASVPSALRRRECSPIRPCPRRPGPILASARRAEAPTRPALARPRGR